jgi:hypothetical protein
MVAIFGLACTVFGAFSCSMVQRKFVRQAPESKIFTAYIVEDSAVAGKAEKSLGVPCSNR